MTKLVIDCCNCVHLEPHRAYEACALKTKNRIIYNGKKEAENCGYYEQKLSEVTDNE